MSFYELDENSATIKQPKGLKIKLRAHQLTSIAAMLEMEKNSTIVIDKPDMTSGLYRSVQHKIYDTAEFKDSTFMINTNSAILADKVGSGKTYMIIGLILASNIPQASSRFLLGTDNFSIQMVGTKESTGVNLIVVPHNLANQWEEFIDKSKLKYMKINTENDFNDFFDIDYVDQRFPKQYNDIVIYSKTAKQNIPIKKINYMSGSKTNKFITQGIAYERKTLNMTKVKTMMENMDVIILNINRYKLFQRIFPSYKWSRVIIDEMDSVNIPQCFNETGIFNWFMTATPKGIFNHSCRRYVYKLFGRHDQLLEYFTIKNKDSFVDQSIVLPTPKVFMINTMLQKMVSVVKDFLPANILQLINAGNMKEAIMKLNCNVDTEDNIIEILTGNIKKDMKKLISEKKYVKSVISALSNVEHKSDVLAGGAIMDIAAANKKMEKIISDIDRCKIKLDAINEKVKTAKDECCFICACPYEMPAVLECCKSKFCLACLLRAMEHSQDKCPYCRQPVNGSKGYHVIGKKIKTKDIPIKTISEPSFSTMDKSNVLESILKYISSNIKTPRILIFSDFPQTFDNIRTNIEKAKMIQASISGTPAHINNVLNDFENGKINILMLDSQHYGSGLNLQSANFVILYHRMSKEVETQVIGRAHRFGRTEPLTVIYLINQTEKRITSLSSNPTYLESSSELEKLLENTDDNASYHSDEAEVDNPIVEPFDPITGAVPVAKKKSKKTKSKKTKSSKRKSSVSTEEVPRTRKHKKRQDKNLS